MTRRKSIKLWAVGACIAIKVSKHTEILMFYISQFINSIINYKY